MVLRVSVKDCVVAALKAFSGSFSVFAYSVAELRPWLGTPLCMPPESARGAQEVGAAGDVFTFGIVAYELLTGKSPYPTPPVLLANADQPLLTISPIDDAKMPRPVATQLAACLSERPDDRPSMSELAAVLGR